MPASASGHRQDSSLVRSFERSLRAERRSERTIDTCFEALEQLTALLNEHGWGLTEATTADIQDYLIDVIERRRPSTANNRFRSLLLTPARRAEAKSRTA